MGRKYPHKPKGRFEFRLVLENQLIPGDYIVRNKGQTERLAQCLLLNSERGNWERTIFRASGGSWKLIEIMTTWDTIKRLDNQEEQEYNKVSK